MKKKNCFIIESEDGIDCDELMGMLEDSESSKDWGVVDVTAKFLTPISKMPVLHIGIKDFVGWYFDDKDSLLSVGNDCYSSLKDTGDFRLNLPMLFSKTGYIPLRLIKNKDVLLEEHKSEDESDEIEDPSDYYRVKFE